MTFDDFWKAWPDKRNKASAEKAFRKLKLPERHKAVDRAEKWCRDWRAQNPQASHIHASTYLNQRRFLDLDEQKQAHENDVKDVMALQISWIKEGSFLCKHISGQMKQRMLESGLVTIDEMKARGMA